MPYNKKAYMHEYNKTYNVKHKAEKALRNKKYRLTHKEELRVKRRKIDSKRKRVYTPHDREYHRNYQLLHKEHIKIMKHQNYLDRKKHQKSIVGKVKQLFKKVKLW